MLERMSTKRRKSNTNGMPKKSEEVRTLLAKHWVGAGATKMTGRWLSPKLAYGLARKTDSRPVKQRGDNYYFILKYYLNDTHQVTLKKQTSLLNAITFKAIFSA